MMLVELLQRFLKLLHASLLMEKQNDYEKSCVLFLHAKRSALEVAAAFHLDDLPAPPAAACVVARWLWRSSLHTSMTSRWVARGISSRAASSRSAGSRPSSGIDCTSNPYASTNDSVSSAAAAS
jgi:hypothetical protein